MLFSKLVPEDAVEYRVYCNGLNSLSNEKEIHELEKGIEEIINKFTCNYLWQKEKMELIWQEEESCFYGKTEFGDSLNDEWLIVYLLFEISRKYLNVVISVWDNDGEFLLIETANQLPCWLQPYNSTNRVFIHGGQLHLITVDPDLKEEFPLERAYVLIQDNEMDTQADESIQSLLAQRILSIPEHLEQNRHRSKCIVPLSIAHLLTTSPQLISAAVEAFVYRDVTKSKGILSKMIHFPPKDPVPMLVEFTRCLFAQLKYETFFPPKQFDNMLPPVVCVGETPHPDRQAAELGAKLTCGFELLLAATQDHFQVQQSEIQHILRDLPLKEDALKSYSSSHFQNDDEQWLTCPPDELEKLLIDKMKDSVPTSVPTSVSQLDQVVTKVNQFVDFVSDYEGAELPDFNHQHHQNNKSPIIQNEKPIEFNVERFLGILKGNIKHQHDLDDLDDDDLDDDDLDDDDLDDDDQDMELNHQLAELMNQMDEELLSSSMGTTFQRQPIQEDSIDLKNTSTTISTLSSSSDQTPEMEESTTKEQMKQDDMPIDLDLNLVQNLLESFSLQEGLPGPTSNLLRQLGIHHQNN